MLRPGGSHQPRITVEGPQGAPLLSLRLRVLLHPQTRLHAELLGPCFKTGRVSDQRVTEQRSISSPANTHDLTANAANTVLQAVQRLRRRHGRVARHLKRHTPLQLRVLSSIAQHYYNCLP